MRFSNLVEAVLFTSIFAGVTFGAGAASAQSDDLFPDPSDSSVLRELTENKAPGETPSERPSAGRNRAEPQQMPPSGESGSPEDPFAGLGEQGSSSVSDFLSGPSTGSGSTETHTSPPPAPSTESAFKRLEDMEATLAGGGSIPLGEGAPDKSSLTLLNIEMNEALVEKSPTVPSLVKLVLATELFLNQRCLGSLYPSLRYEGPPTDPKCIEYTEKILNWQPSNPVGTCVRDGIDSPSCRQAYDLQQVEKGDPWSSEGAYSNFPSQLGANLQPGYTAAQNDLMEKQRGQYEAFERQFNELEDPEAKRESLRSIRRAGEAWIRTACELSGNRFQRNFDSDSDRDSQKYLDELQKALAKLNFRTQEDQILQIRQRVEADFKGKRTARSKDLLQRALRLLSGKDEDVSYGRVDRIRLVPERCHEAATRLQTIDPRSPSALCGMEGYYTPRCIDIIRQRKADAEQERATRKMYLEQKHLLELQQQQQQQQLQKQQQQGSRTAGTPGADGQPDQSKSGFKTF